MLIIHVDWWKYIINTSIFESILYLQHFFLTCLKLLHSTIYIYIYLKNKIKINRHPIFFSFQLQERISIILNNSICKPKFMQVMLVTPWMHDNHWSVNQWTHEVKRLANAADWSLFVSAQTFSPWCHGNWRTNLGACIEYNMLLTLLCDFLISGQLIHTNQKYLDSCVKS